MSLIPAEYPPAWVRHLNSLSKPLTLDVAGLTVAVETSRRQLERTYLPVLAVLISRFQELAGRTAGSHENRRLLAGLAGIPGGGKSTFVGLLDHVARQVVPELPLVTVSMDGWHLPNRILDSRTTTGRAGRPISLRRRKGGPDSYDTPALAAAVRQLRQRGQAVSLPVYDRRIHDPVAGGVTVPADASIILIEGNYLFCESGDWAEVSSLLDVKLFLETDPAVAHERVIARHIRGGLSESQAHDKYEENDAINMAIIADTAENADYLIRL